MLVTHIGRIINESSQPTVANISDHDLSPTTLLPILKNSLRKNNKNIISKFQILLLNCNSAAYIDGFSDNLDIKIIYWYILGILSLWQNHSRRFETRVTLILWKVELFYFIPLNELDEIILNQKKFKGYLRSLFFAYNWTLRTIISWWLILDVGEVFLNTDIFVTNTLSLAFFNFFKIAVGRDQFLVI